MTSVNRLQIGAGLAGGVLVVVGLLADALGLSSPGFSTGQLLLVLAGGVLVLAAALGARFADAYRAAGLLLLNTLVMILLIEAASGVVSKLISEDAGDEDTTNALTLPLPVQHRYFQSADWTEAYLRDAEQTAALQSAYHPFTIWASPPFNGEVIHVSDDFIRQTPGAVCEDGSYTLFAFGGSTMLGIGVPDWGTIPAYLQTALDERLERPVCVVNYGRAGFVNTQEVIELILALKAGGQPDFVIFYDGTNEVAVGYENGNAQGHANQADIERRILGQGEEDSPAQALIDALEDRSYTARLLRRYLDDPAPIPTPPSYDLDALAAEVLANYYSNYRVVEALAAAYDFEFAFFWQPIIFRDKPLTGEEVEHLQGRDPQLVEFYHHTYDALDMANYPHMYDLSEAFAAEEAYIWGDWLHLVPEGNALIAGEMLKIIGRDE